MSRTIATERLEERLLAYHQQRPHWHTSTDGYYECGPDFGVARLYADSWDAWRVDWITVEECPVDLAELPKGAPMT